MFIMGGGVSALSDIGRAELLGEGAVVSGDIPSANDREITGVWFGIDVIGNGIRLFAG